MVWTSEFDFPGSSYRWMGSPKTSFFSERALSMSIILVRVDHVLRYGLGIFLRRHTKIVVWWFYLIWQPPHHLWWPEWNHVKWRKESPGCLRSGSEHLLEERGLSWTSYPMHASRLDCLRGKPWCSVAEICLSASRCLLAKTLEIPSAPARQNHQHS